MAGKIVLGKTHEDLEREEAKKQREKEAQIQNSIAERQAKIEALHKKQATNKIIIISAASAIAAGLTFFGIYNTFFKKGITLEEDVAPYVTDTISTLSFPYAGLDNYLSDNCDTLFRNYAQINSNSVNQLVVDRTSCYVNRVRPITSNLAQVYFSVDIESIENDTVITDEKLLREIRKQTTGSDTITQNTIDYNDIPMIMDDDVEPVSNTSYSGLKIVNLSNKEEAIEIDEKSSTENSAVEKIDSSEEIISNDDSTIDNLIDDSIEDSNIVDLPEDFEIDPNLDSDIDSDTDDPIGDLPEDPFENSNPTVETPNDSKNTNKIKDENGNVVEYYLDSDGRYYRIGNNTRERYNFLVVIDYFYKYDGETPVAGGYRPVTDLILYTLNDINQTEFDSEENPIVSNPAFEFEGEPLDENTTEKIRIKVDKTLLDLYEMRDVSQDFMNYRTFNSYDATYVQLDDIKVYAQPNYLGYNTFVKYTILTNQGFTYSIQTYMTVEESGNSYVIKDIL